MGTPASPDFVVVGIVASERERTEVASLCRESGVAQAA
jgi:diphthamide synthase (EF-2-diphthine--ammonia ligase)